MLFIKKSWLNHKLLQFENSVEQHCTLDWEMESTMNLEHLIQNRHQYPLQHHVKMKCIKDFGRSWSLIRKTCAIMWYSSQTKVGWGAGVFQGFASDKCKTPMERQSQVQPSPNGYVTFSKSAWNTTTSVGFACARNYMESVTQHRKYWLIEKSVSA